MQNHLQRVGDARCAFVRCMVFANTAMASRSNLEREMLSWIDKEGCIPPGNGPEQELWEVSHPAFTGFGQLQDHTIVYVA